MDRIAFPRRDQLAEPTMSAGESLQGAAGLAASHTAGAGYRAEVLEVVAEERTARR